MPLEQQVQRASASVSHPTPQGAPARTSNHGMTNAHGLKQFKQDHVLPTPSNRQAATGLSAHLRHHGVRPAHPEDQQTLRTLTSVSGTTSQSHALRPLCPPSLQGSPLTAAKMSTLRVTSTKLTSQHLSHTAPADSATPKPNLSKVTKTA